jgi:hypothetical protein
VEVLQAVLDDLENLRTLDLGVSGRSWRRFWAIV